MTLRFRAAALPQAGEQLRIETIAGEPPGAGEVRVRIGAAGLCQTDLKIIERQLPKRLTAHRIPLDEINRGFDDLKAGRAIRPVVVFGGEP